MKHFALEIGNFLRFDSFEKWKIRFYSEKTRFFEAKNRFLHWFEQKKCQKCTFKNLCSKSFFLRIFGPSLRPRAEKAKNRAWPKKIDFVKVRDIQTPIQPRKKKHQTSISLALKKFQYNLRWLWDNCKTFDFCPLKHPSRGKSLKKVSWEGNIRNFCNYLRDAASGPKIFLGPN